MSRVVIISLMVCKTVLSAVNRDTVRLWDFPHSAFISASPASNPAFKTICGATVISNRVLVTAAQCLMQCLPDCVIVVSIGDDQRCEGFNYTVDSYKVHSDFLRKTFTNDIALLRLKDTITFSRKVKKAVLTSATPFGDIARVAGWGRMGDTKQNRSKELLYEKQLIWFKEDCAKTLTGIPEGTICAGERVFKDYTARGDAGGGLVVNEYILVGIASYNHPSVSQTVTVYTEIAHFYDWIDKNLLRLHCLN